MKIENKNILSINNLCIDFKAESSSVRVVNRLSFNLIKGTTLGIVGESGSGKSVTALSIMRLLQEAIYAGEINLHIDGTTHSILKLNNKQMRSFRGNRIAMIFQEPMTSLNPSMRCGRQIEEALQLHLGLTKTKARRQTLRLLEEVRLPHPKNLQSLSPRNIGRTKTACHDSNGYQL